jgi:general secretion pathway protein D
MNKSKRVTLLLALLLASCTSFRSYNKGRDYEVQERWDDAVQEYAKALQVDPGNLRYRISLQRAKLEASRQHFEKGKALFLAGQNEMAVIELEIVSKLDPTNQFAAEQLQKALRAVNEERAALDAHSIDAVKRQARDITKTQPPVLNPASDEPISLDFPRETPVKDIYRALGNAFGINILFDAGVKDDRIAIELRDVTAQQALERVIQAANHFYKTLDEKTIIIIPDNPQARRDYEDLVIQTFYLSNGDAEQVTNVVRTMIEARNVFPLKALNAITIRDTADKVRIAEKIIEANDKAKAEVVVDVELLQLDVTKARDLGLKLLNDKGTAYGPGASIVGADGKALSGLTLSQLRDLTSNNFGFTIPNASYGFLKSNTDSQLLAKPQMRISEGEKATLTIGQRIPVPVSTFSAVNTGGTQGTYAPVTSFQYQDVGIKITMEPRVHHNREVTLKLTIEVSNLAGYVEDTSPKQPIIGTRTIESTIRLKDGETNFLAGLIRKDDSNSVSTTPFLGDIPIIGRLFNRESKDSRNTDLVLTMSPHIVRIPDVTADDVAPMWVGTQNNLTFRGVSPRIESMPGAAGDPFTARGGEEQFTEPRAGDFPRSQEAQPNPVYLPPGSAPSDPFTQPRPEPLPPSPEDPDNNTNAQPELKLDTNHSASSVTTGASMTARLAPQPMTLAVKPGELKRWSVVGMELDGLTTESLNLTYDPRSLDVVQVSLGSAIHVDPMAPPSVVIDHAKGTIRVTSTDGKPLTFEGGGDVLVLQLRGMAAGEGLLVLGDPQLRNGKGEAVATVVTGGHTRVQ